MTWFKSDDMLADHPKVIGLGKDVVPAMGLWLLVGTWAARYSTDGFVPDAMVRRYDPRRRLSQRLVEVGLWDRAEVDGATGYQFHDWLDHQLSAKEVSTKRSSNRERQRKFREKNGRYGTDPKPPSGGATPHEQASDQEQQSDGEEGNGVSSDVSNAPRNALLTSTPSRPDPYPSTSRGNLESPSGTFVAAHNDEQPPTGGRRGTRIPDDFTVTDAMVTWAQEHAPHVDGRIETEQFRDYWTAKSGRDATKLDWTATWRTWMRKAEQQTGQRTHRRPAARPSTGDRAVAEVHAIANRFRDHHANGEITA